MLWRNSSVFRASHESLDWNLITDPVPAKEKQHHGVMSPPPCFTTGMVFFFMFFLHQTYLLSSSILVSSTHKTFYHMVYGDLVFCFCFFMTKCFSIHCSPDMKYERLLPHAGWAERTQYSCSSFNNGVGLVADPRYKKCPFLSPWCSIFFFFFDDDLHGVLMLIQFHTIHFLNSFWIMDSWVILSGPCFFLFRWTSRRS